MIVYSAEYEEGRSLVKRYEWFDTERAADEWVHLKETMRKRRNVVGPNKHVIEGKAGLLSFLRTYRK